MKQSSNAFANGADQNCGNVITDRPSTRVHAPPGGASQISLGGEPTSYPAPAARAPTAQEQDRAENARSNVTSNIFGAPSNARSGSSNAFANGADQNCGNVITDRPSTRLHAPPGGKSSISFGGDYDAPTHVPYSRPTTAAAAAKHAEAAGHDIFNAAPEPAPTMHAPEIFVPESAAPTHVEATETHIRAMLIAELRTICRDNGINPAGAKNTLVDRLCAAVAAGEVKIMVSNKSCAGTVTVGNNYGRSAGQNVGNFMTGRNSSRVLAPPGGGSSFSLGGYGSEPAEGTHQTVSRQ